MLALIVIFTTAKSAKPVAEEHLVVDLMDIEEEIRLGKQLHNKKIEHSGIYDDPKLTSYVEEIGAILLRAAPIEGFEPTFTITNSGMGGAKASAGGYIYIDRAYLALVNDEAELAATLAHELGHVAARDMARAHSLGIADPCRTAATSSLDTTTIESFYHQSEFRADAYAVRMMLRTGYDPMAVAAMLEPTELKGPDERDSDPEDNDEESCLSTHPAAVDRILRIEDIIDLAEVESFRRGREVYLSMINGMVWGLNFDLLLGPGHGMDLDARIEVVEVQPGDTFDSLIRTPGLNAWLSSSSFELLNRLDRDAPLAVGTFIKLVR